MNVPDSSAWIEYFREGSLAPMFAPIMEDRQTLIVPSIVIYEVYKWMLLKFGEEGAMNARSMMMRGKVILLDPELAIAAARISVKHKLAMADAIIYATTLTNAAELWTSDAHFSELSNVRYFSKK